MGLFTKSHKKNYTTSMLMPNVSYVPRWSVFSRSKAINEGFKRSTWVYSCVRLRAANIASVPWFVERDVGGEWERDDTHDLARLIANPSPQFSWPAIIRQMIYGMDLSGDGYASVVSNGLGKPIEVWPIIPDVMEIRPGTVELVREYVYRKGSVTKTMMPSEVLHLKYTHPGDVYYGLSPLEAAGRAVDIDEEAERWQKISLQNMAVPPGMYSLDGVVSQPQFEQAVQYIREQSGPENARKPIVTANAKWQSLGQTPVDLDFTNGRKLSREEICSAYSVPPPLVGIYENATLANIQTARTILWREGLIPVLDEIEEQLNTQLASRYTEQVRLRYDLSNVEALAENYTEKVNNARTLWSMGLPLETINKRLDLQLDLAGVEGVDVGYLGAGLLPVGFELEEQTQGSRQAGEDAYGT